MVSVFKNIKNYFLNRPLIRKNFKIMIEMTLPGEMTSLGEMGVIDNAGTLEAYLVNNFKSGGPYRSCCIGEEVRVMQGLK
jgi:hypothetical protein